MAGKGREQDREWEGGGARVDRKGGEGETGRGAMGRGRLGGSNWEGGNR